MTDVSTMETVSEQAARKQAEYAAKRAVHVASALTIAETPGQEFWPVYRKQSDFSEAPPE